MTNTGYAQTCFQENVLTTLYAELVNLLVINIMSCPPLWLSEPVNVTNK